LSDFDIIAKAAVLDMLETRGEEVVYTGAGADTHTHAVIDKSVDLLGLEGALGESRWICGLAVEIVGQPHRGDTVTTATGVEWILGESLTQTDRWFTWWTVTRR